MQHHQMNKYMYYVMQMQHNIIDIIYHINSIK